MGNSLVVINTVISIVVLILVCIVLYLQLKHGSAKKAKDEGKTAPENDEISPVFSFYSGKIHNSGIISMKVKNSGGKIKEMLFSADAGKIEFRGATQELLTDQETTVSLVPNGFNFTDNYFQENEVTFSVNYKDLLNDTHVEKFKIEDLNSISQISRK